MREVVLLRIKEGDWGTLGTIGVRDSLLYTMELPWRENTPNISRIPQGKYFVDWAYSAKYNYCYQLHNVEGRSNILFHCGNWAGDTEKEYRTDSAGCILLGTNPGYLSRQRAILNSRASVYNFNTLLDKKSFLLYIHDAFQ